MIGTLAICTRKISDATSLLITQLKAQKISLELLGVQCRILIVSNTPEDAQGTNHTKDGVHIIHCHRQGYASVRNAVLDWHLVGDFVIFIDDDEVPGVDWAIQLMKAYRRFSADVVFGKIECEVPRNLKAWFGWRRFYQRSVKKTGTPVKTGGTGNCLISSSIYTDERLRFDEFYNQLGGEDTDYFLAAAARNRKLIYCQEAVVTEQVPSSKCTLEYLILRNFKNGLTTTRAQLRYSGKALRLTSKIIAVGLILCPLYIFLLIMPLHNFRAYSMLGLAVMFGKMVGLTYFHAGRYAEQHTNDQPN